MVVHLFTCCLEGRLHLSSSCIDTLDILCGVSFLELSESTLDSCLLIGRELIAEFLQLLLCLEDQTICLIELRDTLAFALVCLCISRCLILHTLDLVIGETAGGFDTDLLLLTRSLVQSGDVQDTISVNIEGDLDLRGLAWGRSYL